MAELNPDVRISADLDAMSLAAVTAFIESSREAVGQRGRFLTALSGGTTPIPLYEALAGTPFRGRVEWALVHAFWGDERCVPVEDLENSYRQVYDILLGRVPIPSANVHRVKTELEPEAAAIDYAMTLKKYADPPLAWPRLDLVLLGMGRDGHTASLFPGSEDGAGAAVLAVTGHYEDRPSRRITLTPEVFNSARNVIFLVSGQAKAEVLKKVLYGESQPKELPAQRIHPRDGRLIWMVDRAAASLL